MAKERNGAAVERVRGDDMAAGAADVEDAHVDGRLAGTQGQPADASFHGGQSLLQHVRRRIHQPCVDVAELLQRKQPARVSRVFEAIARCLIDRQRTAQRVRIHRLPRMKGQRFQVMFFLPHSWFPRICAYKPIISPARFRPCAATPWQPCVESPRVRRPGTAVQPAQPGPCRR